MEEKLQLEEVDIIYGSTTINELKKYGYSVANLEQMFGELEIRTACTLVRGYRAVAFLYFDNISQKVIIEQLNDSPIDFALLLNDRPKFYVFSIKTKIKLTILANVISIPILLVFDLIINQFENVNFEEIGFLILSLPTIFFGVLWGNNLAFKKGNILKKMLLILSLFLQLVITVGIWIIINTYVI